MERETQVYSTTTLLQSLLLKTQWMPFSWSACCSLDNSAKTHFRMSLKPSSAVRNGLE